MRNDLDILQQWIKPESRVLDLGCGSGELLERMTREKKVTAYGIEIDPENITRCVEKRVNVIEQDLDEGLKNFDDGSFDTVVMSQTLQAVRYPHLVLDEMLRVGRECVVSFPNFGYWRCRVYLGMRGHMPVSKFLPYTWYDTPNIHFCTIDDFEDFCREKNIRIINRRYVTAGRDDDVLSVRWPNMLAEMAIYRLTR
ncbi:MAG: methionine biosynthesis protein MetW [Pseudomonadales bacterium]|jgi:methionine biosynthesis protein MetW|nr:methionine biosynthesis protein MetW [Pseudomonadales bacterium]